MSEDSSRSWMPVVAGILDIISGATALVVMLVILAIILPASGSEIFVILVAVWYAVAAILAVLGGAYSLRRRGWGLALAGSIAALLGGNFIFGTLSIIFTALSRKEFN